MGRKKSKGTCIRLSDDDTAVCDAILARVRENGLRSLPDDVRAMLAEASNDGSYARLETVTDVVRLALGNLAGKVNP